MNKEARLPGLVLTVAVIAGFAGCGHKPAYSDIDANRGSTNQNQNARAEAQANANAPVSTDPLASPEARQPSPEPTRPAFKSPTFVDQATGGIKDLPSYPKSRRISVQIGPVQGLNTMAVGFTTTDAMDKIAAYFDRVIKENKWIVADKIIDPEFSEWTLKKGVDNDAKVQIKKDPKNGAMGIVIVRSEKLEAPSK